MLLAATFYMMILLFPVIYQQSKASSVFQHLGDLPELDARAEVIFLSKYLVFALAVFLPGAIIQAVRGCVLIQAQVYTVYVNVHVACVRVYIVQYLTFSIECISCMQFRLDIHHSLYAMLGIDFNLNAYII
jgi:hypothetical protein